MAMAVIQVAILLISRFSSCQADIAVQSDVMSQLTVSMVTEVLDGQLLDIRSSSRAERQLLRLGNTALKSGAKQAVQKEQNDQSNDQSDESEMNFIELLNLAALQSLIMCFLIKFKDPVPLLPEAEKAQKALSKKALKQMIWWKAGFVHLAWNSCLLTNLFHSCFTMFRIFHDLSMFSFSFLARQLQKLCKGLANRICQQITFCATWD